MAKKQKIIGQCKLCLKKKIELCESHIFSELLYKQMYDSKHRALEIGVRNSRLTKDTIQKGIRERLFCLKCEGKINRYETYFKERWYGIGGIPNSLTRKEIVIANIDYQKYKLFHLSILFRLGIAAEYPNVILGHHEGILRYMLLNGDPGKETDYFFIGEVLTNGDEVVHGFISSPLVGEFGGYTVIRTVFGGCDWLYVLTNPYFAISASLMRYAKDLRENGVLTLYRKDLNRFLDDHPMLRGGLEPY